MTIIPYRPSVFSPYINDESGFECVPLWALEPGQVRFALVVEIRKRDFSILQFKIEAVPVIRPENYFSYWFQIGLSHETYYDAVLYTRRCLKPTGDKYELL